MAEESLSPGLDAAVRALKHERGPCPPAEELVEYEALDGAGRAAHPIDPHVQICSRCQLVLLHVKEERPVTASRSFSWQWAAGLAAALVLIAIVPLVFKRGAEVPPSEATIRGTELQPVAPLGNIETLDAFRWQSPLRNVRYRVSVYRATERIWSETTEATSLKPSAPVPLDRAVEYRWVVEAIDSDGDVRMASSPQAFRLTGGR
jgi:hypothetical protein